MIKNPMSLLFCTMLSSLIFATTTAARADIGVVTTIKPIHSLVSSIMQGVATPHLIIKGAGNPHAYNLRPSDAKALSNAALVFWVGPQLEHFLESPLHTLSQNASIISLSDAKGLTLLSNQEGDEAHDHQDTHNHASSEIDMHIWLSPLNAIVMADSITSALQKADPDHKEIYLKNNAKLKNELEELDSKIKAQLADVTDVAYLTFHDAFLYFEHHYGLNQIGAITLNPNVQPSPKKLFQIQETIKIKKPACIFIEPQYDPRVVYAITEGQNIKIASLDAIGFSMEEGPALFGKLMHQNAKNIFDCLSSH